MWRSEVTKSDVMSSGCSCWQRLHGSEEETVDAFERALGACDHLDELHQLWTE